MKIDLHCHSKYSGDNHLEPEDLIAQAIKMNLDGVCLTEHHSITPLCPLERIRLPEGFYVFRGLEISTVRGHLLVYGMEDDSWNIWGSHTYLDAFGVIVNVHRLGGICVPSHPFRGYDSFGEHVLEMEGFDALETHNGINSEEMNRKAIRSAVMRSLPSIGGSDCHSREQVGRAFTEFKNPVSTISALVEEIKKGNCRGVIAP